MKYWEEKYKEDNAKIVVESEKEGNENEITQTSIGD